MLAVAALPMMSAFGDTMIYNSNPSPLPGNLPSLGYQANQTAEFGDLIQFAPGPRNLTSATVTMSDWALESTYETVGTSAGYTHPLTLNLYTVGAGNTVGSLIGSDTISAFVPWRPEADPTCPGGTAWRNGAGTCFNGLAFQVSFDFSGLLVPDEVIYGLAFNTNTWGYNPIGLPGPYESLNFGLSAAGASIGSDPLPGTAYWNTMTAANYTDGGTGGVGTFRQDTGWAYVGAIDFQATAVPEPTGIILLGTLVGALGLLRRRKRAA
jgi:hypothetical protein